MVNPVRRINKAMRTCVRVTCLTAAGAIGATVSLLALSLLVVVVLTYVPLTILYILAEEPQHEPTDYLDR